MPRDISLANKCLLLFGGAVVLIVLAALTAPWLRMNALVDEREQAIARRLVEVWQRLDAQARERGEPPIVDKDGAIDLAGIKVRWVPARDFAQADDLPRFIRTAIERFEADPKRGELASSSWDGLTRVHRYARAVFVTGDTNETGLAGMIVHETRSEDAGVLLVVNTVYLLSAGLVVLGLALLVFYLITHKIILGPVRSLRETAEAVRAGDLTTRSEIRTGDEFEELADTFNRMLAALHANQEQQRSINKALDLKLNELAEANVALFEANKLKGEFLASVSHELRTPLNSIIGFAELLLEIARVECDSGEPPPSLTKRIRFLENIVSAGKNLLELIESLLEMAKLEAGRVEISSEPVSLADACETLAALIHPLAKDKGIEVVQEIAPDLPAVYTDAKKLHQIVFNFLSNAVKFIEPPHRSGRPGRITLRVERLIAGTGDEPDRVRISVIDTGPGIPADELERVFDKFHQLDGGHTREHQGTGLGLAISKELANLLQGQIQLVSELGRGSMFSLILPVRPDPERWREQKLEGAFRGALAAQRGWDLGTSSI